MRHSILSFGLFAFLVFTSGTAFANGDCGNIKVSIDIGGFCGSWKIKDSASGDGINCSNGEWSRGNCEVCLKPATYTLLTRANHGMMPSFAVSADGQVSVLNGHDGQLATGGKQRLSLLTEQTTLDIGGYKNGYAYEYVGSGVENDKGCQAPARFVLPRAFKYLTFPGGVWIHNFNGVLYSERTDVWSTGPGILTMKLKTARVTAEPVEIVTGKPANLSWRVMVFQETESNDREIVGKGTTTVPQRLQLQLNTNTGLDNKGQPASGFFSVQDNCKPSVERIEIGNYAFKLTGVCDQP